MPRSPWSQFKKREIAARRASPLAAAGLALAAMLGFAAPGQAEHRVRNLSDGYRPTDEVSDRSESQISPDGRWVVFVVCDDANLCRLASSRRFADAGEVPRTLDGPVYGFSAFGSGIDFAISGDSRRVVFDARSAEDAENDLWSVEIDGSAAPVRLNATLLADESINSYEVTADGQQVVFELSRPGTNLLQRVAIDGTGGATTLDEGDDIRFYLFPAASGNPRLLYFIDTDGNNQLEILTTYLASPLPFALWGGQLRAGAIPFSVEFTPDGEQVVFILDQDVDGVDELWSIRTDSSNTIHQLNPTLIAGGDVVSYGLSSDGRAVFRADASVDERFDLWSAPIDDSAAPIQISGALVGGGDVQSLRVSGEWAVYIADASVDDRDELWSVPADGHEAPTRRSDTVPAGRDVASFRFTPSGSRLVYRANLGSVDRWDLYTTTVFGFTSHVRLTNRNPFAPNPYSVRTYSVSPDAQRVAFAVTPDANWHGVLMEQKVFDPLTTAETLLEVAGADEDDYFPDYLPDSRGLAVQAIREVGERREVYLLDEGIFVDGFGSGDLTAWSASVP